MIEAAGLTFAYGAQPVVRDVSLRTTPGRVLGLIGPNGSGKTTVLRMLYGALTPTQGEVRLDDELLKSINPRTVARKVAVVAQESDAETALTVSEMVLLGRTPHLGTFQRASDADHAIAQESLDRVGMSHLAQRSFVGLSGGERQRVLIARALTQDTEHMLLDEPTNHLDIRYQHGILQLVSGLGLSSVVVLHDLNLAAHYCDDLVLLEEGQVVRQGPTEQVLDPEVLTDVYQIPVRRVEMGDHFHLVFEPPPHGPHHPRPETDPTSADPTHRQAHHV